MKGYHGGPCAKCEKPTVGQSKYCYDHRKESRANFRQMVVDQAAARATKVAEFERLWQAALAAGRAAGDATTPVPMVVQQHTNPVDDASPVEQSWYVKDGVCGFASVVVTPGTTSFALWATKTKDAHRNYYGGTTVYRVAEYNQSYTRKEAFATAFAGVLQAAGVNARADARLD